MMNRRFSLLISLAILVLPACSSVSVRADHKYGQTRAVGLDGVPIETVADQFKTVTAGRSSKPEGPLSAEVLSVHDGDSITVLIDGHKEKVRLIGIDAPELDQAPWGEHSQVALKALAAGKTVRLETDIIIRDQYRRLLAYVYVGDLFVNAELIRQGHAVLYTVPPNVAHIDEYRKAQAEARDAGRGVWDPDQPLDVNPDCFRKQQKGREC